MKELFTAYLVVSLFLTADLRSQTFYPTSFIDSLDNPERVFKSNVPSDSIVLTKYSVAVVLGDTTIRALVSKLFRTVTDTLSKGVGVAAPQIGVNKRIVLVQRFDKANEPFEAYLNPTILKSTKLVEKRAEGCLSVDNFRGKVERPYAIMLSYYDVNGGYRIELVEGFTARIFLHEIDHLDGILFTERVCD